MTHDSSCCSTAAHRPSDDTSRQFFSRLVDRVRQDLDLRLAHYFDRRVLESQALGEDVSVMVDAVRDLTLRGGKRLRAALVVAGFASVDSSADQQAALDAGAAFELLQTYLLIHDDWMDGDEMRRGGPSVPALMLMHHRDRHLADCASILAGDYAAALALDLLCSANVAPERLAVALRVFARIQTDVICGQQLDVSGTASNLELHYALKTGSYTVKGPLLLGAALAGASELQVQRLVAFADPIGIAFQMCDDLLGVFGDSSKTGKPVGEDLRQGKRTVVVREAREMLAQSEWDQVQQVLGNSGASDAQLSEVIRMLLRSGVKERVEQRIERLVLSAKEGLLDAPISTDALNWLWGATLMLTARSV
jgi:geranylgeranyl diphosphate synthase type I